MGTVGGDVPEPVPVEETRGGEEAGDWKVDDKAVAHAETLKAQIAAMADYINQKYGKESGAG